MNNIDRTIDCLERAIEVVKNSVNVTEIHIRVDADIDSFPTLEYEIDEVSPKIREANDDE